MVPETVIIVRESETYRTSSILFIRLMTHVLIRSVVTSHTSAHP